MSSVLFPMKLDNGRVGFGKDLFIHLAELFLFTPLPRSNIPRVEDRRSRRLAELPRQRLISYRLELALLSRSTDDILLSSSDSVQFHLINVGNNMRKDTDVSYYLSCLAISFFRPP